MEDGTVAHDETSGDVAPAASADEHDPTEALPVETMWEVFGRRRINDALEHVGQIHAGDRDTALLLARETHFRHEEAVDYAVVRSDQLHRLARSLHPRTSGGHRLPTAAGLLGVPRQARECPRGSGSPGPPGPADTSGAWSRRRIGGVMTSLRAAPGVSIASALAAPRSRLLLVLGDDDLITGHRASYWTGVAPAIEMDLAFATIAQDGINHADLWYQLIMGTELAGNDPQVRAAVDAIGLGREPGDYRHAILCERPPGDIAFSVARHIVVDHVIATRLEVLTDSQRPGHRHPGRQDRVGTALPPAARGSLPGPAGRGRACPP